ncbi:MAG: ion transporter [Oscillospiraceae bacterium]|nr:ion transporter [Oscillospiraceae bacterium]
MSKTGKESPASKKQRIFDIIQIGNTEDLPSRAFDWFIAAAIILNILVMILGTFDSLSPFRTLLRVLELGTIGIFCVEYILRIWTADLLYPEREPFRARLRFLRSFDGIVDLLTILPFFFLDGFIVFRLLRVVRIFHLFRLNAQYDSFQIITNVLYEKRNQILSSLFIIIVLMFASSLCMYSAEHDAQPDAFRNAFSGVWWSMSTLLTVGYGDIYPVTAVGKFMAICIAFLGVGAVAIPTGIISAGFVARYTEKEHAESRFRDLSEVGEILVQENDELCGLRIDEAQEHYGMQILLLQRSELTVLPRPELKIQAADILIVRSEKLVKKHRRKMTKQNRKT